jgi:hypothetical protein
MGLTKDERARERALKLGKKREKRRIEKRVFNEMLRSEKYEEIERDEKYHGKAGFHPDRT